MDSHEMQKRATDCLAQGQLEEASALYTQCLEEDPDNLSHYWHLGLAYLLQGNQASAQEVWFSAIMAVPPEALEQTTADLSQVLLTAAQHQLQTGHRAVAIQLYEQVIELDDERADVHDALGHLLAQQGRLDDAIATWQLATELNPALTQTYYHLAELFQRLEQFEDAIACYTTVLEDTPDSREATYNLGLCLSQQQQFDQAIAYFQRAAQLDPNFAPAYGEWGMTLVFQGQFEDGIAQLRHAISLNSTFVRQYGDWAIALEQQGTLSSAIANNASCLKALGDGTVAEVLLKLGWLLAERGVVKGAIACLQQSAALDPNLAPDVDVTIHSLNVPSEASQMSVQTTSGVVDIPAGFYESTYDWVTTSGLDSHYQRIYPPSELRFTPPKTLDNTVDIRFRFGDAMELPGSFVATIPNGRYWIDEQQQTAVITPNNRLLGDVSPDFPILSPGHPDKHPSQHSIFNRASLPAPTQIDETIAVLSSLFNDAYFHWMFDVLPRIELLRLSEISINTIDYFLVNDRFPFQRETLNRLSIPSDRILAPATHSHIQAKQLIVPSFPASISWMPEWVCEFLRRMFLDEGAIANSKKIQRLYISRNHTANRRIINELEITNLLDKLGFQTVVLESLSVVEQAALLSHAKVVVAPHGGGLTNVVFCQPETKVIELFSPNYVYPCYWLVSQWCHLDYYYLLGELPAGMFFNQLLYPNPRTEDILINPNKLLNLLQLAGIS